MNKTERYKNITDEALLNECKVDTFRSGGAGGQNVNKRDTAVRLTHKSGMVVKCTDERTQGRNKRIALKRLREKLLESLREKKTRTHTHTPTYAHMTRLDKKKAHGQKKSNRKKVVW
jgi:protein subunit release factor B